MPYLNLKKNTMNKGFTLLEALVATSILMVAVAAPITIAQKGLSSAIYSKNQMIASYLAQDAIEFIKNKRDEVFIANNDWKELTIFDKCLDSEWCAIDTKAIDDDGEIGKIIEDETGKLKKEKDISGNFEFYGYGPGDDTGFSRAINIKINPANEDEALINVRVVWGEDGNYVEIKTLIYNI